MLIASQLCADFNWKTSSEKLVGKQNSATIVNENARENGSLTSKQSQ